MNNIILVQHCQSEHHINNISGGWTDSSLTIFGKEQANKIGLRLKNTLEKRDEYVLYSSDLSRASQTADIIGENLRLNVNLEIGLRELNTGLAIGKTKEWEKYNRNPLKDNKFDMEHREFDEGESWAEFYLRVSNTMNKILKKENKKNLIIVTHGGTLAYIVAWWLIFEPEMLNRAYFQSEVGSITKLSKNRFNQRTLNKFNDLSHF